MKKPSKTDEELLALLAAARQVSARAYAPYSNFRVGAALRAQDGSVFTGVNVENASYGLTLCAERAALAAAIGAGTTRFVGLAIYSPDAGEGLTPCGACLQVLAEFVDDMPIITQGAQTPPRQMTLGELMPARFELR